MFFPVPQLCCTFAHKINDYFLAILTTSSPTCSPTTREVTVSPALVKRGFTNK